MTSLPPASGIYAGGYVVGTVVWKVNGGVNTDGQDIVPGLFHRGQDFFFGPPPGPGFGLVDISNAVEFNGATVNVVPEPGTAALVGLALLGLSWPPARRARAGRICSRC